MPTVDLRKGGALLIEVHLLTGRYHGVGDWPPAPFRLFQALVAGAYGGRWAGEDRAGKDAAFRWLEGLPPPLIAAPARRPGRAVMHFVPNNDLDAKAGDPRRTSEIRAPKRRQPTLLEDPVPGGDRAILYVWPIAGDGAGDDTGDGGHAARIAALADRLHTLGHGIDAAYANAELTDWPSAENRIAAHGGAVFRPSGTPGRPGDPLCPVPGSLDSLHARHAERARQFQIRAVVATVSWTFAALPSPIARRWPTTRRRTACCSNCAPRRRPMLSPPGRRPASPPLPPLCVTPQRTA